MGKNSRSNSCLHCSQLLPFLKHPPKNLNTAPVSTGRIRITNVLSSTKPKLCISSNLLTKRKIASGSSEVRDGTCRNNSTITGTTLLKPPTLEPKLASGGPLRVASKDTSICTLACAVSACCYFPWWPQSSATLASAATVLPALHYSSAPRNKVVEARRRLTCKSPRELQPCNTNTSPQDAQTKSRSLNRTLAEQREWQSKNNHVLLPKMSDRVPQPTRLGELGVDPSTGT